MSTRIRIRAVLLTLAALVGLAVVSLGLWLRGSLPDFRGSLRVPGIEAPVNIIRDANAVPHIFAARELDAYYALGFVHASDRLWQMDLMRRLAAGRLSEIFGEPALSTDKLMRTLGLHALASQAVEYGTPTVRNALDAYATGVNAWMDHAEQSLPPEFLALRYRPEPWQPADSLAWGKLMAWQLSGNMRQEVLRARLAEILPAKSVDQLLPSGIGQTEEQRAAHAAKQANLSPGLTGPQADALLDLLGPGPDTPSASNVWAIGPERTATGGAILANDPHLGLSVPIPWYLARIESPKLAVRGATVP
ncbi:MAG: penicillin acylase family protein, partial [Pseudomonadota bacterium]